MSRDHTKNVKDSEICPCAKFRFKYIFVARNIANKHFSLKKAPDPGVKHLEFAICGGVKIEETDLATL